MPIFDMILSRPVVDRLLVAGEAFLERQPRGTGRGAWRSAIAASAR